MRSLYKWTKGSSSCYPGNSAKGVCGVSAFLTEADNCTWPADQHWVLLMAHPALRQTSTCPHLKGVVLGVLNVTKLIAVSMRGIHWEMFRCTSCTADTESSKLHHWWANEFCATVHSVVCQECQHCHAGYMSSTISASHALYSFGW